MYHSKDELRREIQSVRSRLVHACVSPTVQDILFLLLAATLKTKPITSICIAVYIDANMLRVYYGNTRICFLAGFFVVVIIVAIFSSHRTNCRARHSHSHSHTHMTEKERLKISVIESCARDCQAHSVNSGTPISFFDLNDNCSFRLHCVSKAICIASRTSNIVELFFKMVKWR